MDDDELMQAFCEFVVINGSDDASAIAVDLDGDFADVAEEEMYDLLMEFGDEFGWNECRRVTLAIYGSDGIT